ncbi:peptide chain release factor N(5)-glutamine methyltransferase [Cognatiluteimonas profundi]|uniref:peptide chain release factor N(5)-glutamine methyltransferase n=1 Tax=Cognatiluteimonas profundi TaxID=2594501 RepID=UPI00131C47EF|nr:peptide chain release factor N(5)-glutamine methyltransferase [Lysobacter profundi]
METPAEGRVDAVLRDARARVDAIDAEYLLAHALGRSRTWIHTHGDAVVDPAARARYAELIRRRADGEPVAYLTGSRGFWTLGLQVTPDTLIPRAETELLVELALARLPGDRAIRIADLGTGSGAIALALASERPRATVLATDASDTALAVARRNAAALGIESITFAQGDWCQALGAATFDLIASNPPYLADADPHRWAGDLRFEPVAALVSGSDGLDALRTIVRDAPAHLAAGGWLLLEHGWEQGESVRRLLIDAGFVDVATEQDLEHRDRVTVGRACRSSAPALT